jgi:hypothetical protein
VKQIENGTLGFEKIFAIGLPERSDKRDALALTTSLTGFKIDWVDGVRGQSISDKALPFGVDRLKLQETNLGKEPIFLFNSLSSSTHRLRSCFGLPALSRLLLHYREALLICWRESERTHERCANVGHL